MAGWDTVWTMVQRQRRQKAVDRLMECNGNGLRGSTPSQGQQLVFLLLWGGDTCFGHDVGRWRDSTQHRPHSGTDSHSDSRPWWMARRRGILHAPQREKLALEEEISSPFTAGLSDSPEPLRRTIQWAELAEINLPAAALHVGTPCCFRPDSSPAVLLLLYTLTHTVE